MSICYKINIANSFFNDLKNFIGEWVKKAGFEDISINKSQDIDQYFIFCKGSIRGISVSFNEKLLKKEVHIKVNTLSSKVDWEMVYSIVIFLH